MPAKAPDSFSLLKCELVRGSNPTGLLAVPSAGAATASKTSSYSAEVFVWRGDTRRGHSVDLDDNPASFNVY